MSVQVFVDVDTLCYKDISSSCNLLKKCINRQDTATVIKTQDLFFAFYCKLFKSHQTIEDFFILCQDKPNSLTDRVSLRFIVAGRSCKMVSDEIEELRKLFVKNLEASQNFTIYLITVSSRTLFGCTNSCVESTRYVDLGVYKANIEPYFSDLAEKCCFVYSKRVKQFESTDIQSTDGVHIHDFIFSKERDTALSTSCSEKAGMLLQQSDVLAIAKKRRDYFQLMIMPKLYENSLPVIDKEFDKTAVNIE